MAERMGFDHFMLKEIFEQPSAIRDTYRGRINVENGVGLEEELGPMELFRPVQRIFIVGCGTSRHAALVGEFMIESFARLPVEVDYASEFRYRDPLLGPEAMVIAVTQSGETDDTLGAMKEARNKGAFLLSISNTGSMAARLADCTFYTRAGLEIGAASTKTFTSQLTAFYLLALFLARVRGAMPRDEIRRRIKLLNRVPEQVERILDNSSGIEVLADAFSSYPRVLYVGRGINYPIALEGAFKLTEVSCTYAEACPAGEMKHGPAAIIDAHQPVIVVAPRDSVHEKVLLSLEELKLRDGLVLAVATEGDRKVSERADYTMRIPEGDDFLNPLLSIVPLQLFAYYTARLRGFDADKPRNPAKSAGAE